MVFFCPQGECPSKNGLLLEILMTWKIVAIGSDLSFSPRQVCSYQCPPLAVYALRILLGIHTHTESSHKFHVNLFCILSVCDTFLFKFKDKDKDKDKDKEGHLVIQLTIPDTTLNLIMLTFSVCHITKMVFVLGTLGGFVFVLWSFNSKFFA